MPVTDDIVAKIARIIHVHSPGQRERHFTAFFQLNVEYTAR